MPIEGPINTSRIENSPFLTKDGLTLYFDSERTDLGGAGDRDLYYSHRDCLECPWQTPVRLGPEINTPYVDFGPKLSKDERLLLFSSHKTRPDCPFPDPPPADPTRPCDSDMFLSQRDDLHDHLAWGPATSLGPDLNLHGENAEALLHDEEELDADEGRAIVVFSRSGPAGGLTTVDLYQAPIRVTRTASGAPLVETFGPQETLALSDLNHPGVLDAGFALRADGKEVYFYVGAQMAGTVGGQDLWVSTRQSRDAPWSVPTNPGTRLNSCAADLAPFLSHDGRTLLFASRRMLGVCAGAPGQPPPDFDLYVSTRTPSGH